LEDDEVFEVSVHGSPFGRMGQSKSVADNMEL
jgi:hypothetical protein